MRALVLLAGFSLYKKRILHLQNPFLFLGL